MDPKPLSSSSVVVLGGTAGVGLETANRFSLLGSRIALLGRNSDRGRAACEAVRAQSPDADVRFFRVDATNADDVIETAATVRRALENIDILVCSTGPSHAPQLLSKVPIADMRGRLEEIILPPLHLMQAVLPHMREQGTGAIVNVASDAAKLATPGETLIGAAMAAIVMFSKAAALEEKRAGIRINVLTPSLIAGTPGADLIFADSFSAKMFEKAAQRAHLGVPVAADLAEMAVFLASPAARRITGQCVSINGGISIA
jgi:NAD(P)-dependent dehydrogenase (short-subunit alcohol dehydrogenase family)